MSHSSAVKRVSIWTCSSISSNGNSLSTMACGKKEEVSSVVSINASAMGSGVSEARESLSAVSAVTVLAMGGVVVAGCLVVAEVRFFDVFGAGRHGHECES